GIRHKRRAHFFYRFFFIDILPVSLSIFFNQTFKKQSSPFMITSSLFWIKILFKTSLNQLMSKPLESFIKYSIFNQSVEERFYRIRLKICTKSFVLWRLK